MILLAVTVDVQNDFVGGDSKPAENNAASDAQLVAEITKQVMAQLGMK